MALLLTGPMASAAEPVLLTTGGGLTSAVELAAVSAGDESVNDPIEPLNRGIFVFNEFLQDGVLRPIAYFYNDNVPADIRRSVSSFLDNLNTPVTLANDVLQLEFERAFDTIVRFFVNTTAGILGLTDVALEMGFEPHKEDFGQTLGSYGVGEGFYVVVPIFGPSNPRDAVGKFFVDPYFNPLGLWLSNTDRIAEKWSLTAVEGIDKYAGIVDELDQVKKTSVDYYAAVRSLYRQKRRTEINNGSQLELPPIPDFELNYDIQLDEEDQPVAGIAPQTAK